MTGKARIRAALMITALALALVAALPSAAMAHDRSLGGPWACGTWQGSYCGYGGVGNNHTWVYACDRSADGRGYFIHYQYVSGDTGQTGDPNGSASGCGGRYVEPVARFQMCTQDPTGTWCTTWVNA